MEYGNVCSYGARIGDLPKLFANQIPKEFFILNENDAQALVNDSLSKLSSNPEIHKQLQADCSIDSLFVEDEHITLEGILKVVPNRDSTLMPLKTLEYLDSTPGTTDADRSPCYLFGRIPKPEVDLSYKNIAEESPESTEVLQDVFVTVMIYRPTCLPLLDISTQVRNLSATQRIVLLGSQKLSDLKDAIRCPQDKVWLGDCSDALDDPVLHIPAEKLYKSSYFFIENTFYDDLRHPENHKLSKTLLEWIRSKTEFNSMGTFTSSSMDTAVLNDLIIFPGKPYYYVHQGNCEHLVIFSDISLIDRGACQSPAAFPMLTGRSNIRSVRCAACNRLPCRWLASNAGCLLPTDPCALCDVCIRLLLYDSDGKKILPCLVVHMYCGEEVVAY